MIDQKHPTIWQSSSAPDSQMFVLWKEAGDGFNPSLSSWAEDARVTWPRRAPKDEKQGKKRSALII